MEFENLITLFTLPVSRLIIAHTADPWRFLRVLVLFSVDSILINKPFFPHCLESRLNLPTTSYTPYQSILQSQPLEGQDTILFDPQVQISCLIPSKSESILC